VLTPAYHAPVKASAIVTCLDDKLLVTCETSPHWFTHRTTA